MDYIIDLLTDSNGGHAVGESNIRDAVLEVKAMQEQIASLLLQIGILQTEVAKWKRAAYYANQDRAKMERKDIERIKESEREQ